MLRKGTSFSTLSLLCGGLSLALLGACGQSGTDNAAPRLTSSIPEQSTASGSSFTLDLATYVSDRETASNALNYQVVSGGGTFAGTTYSNTFAMLGTHTVTVRVTDAQGKALDTTFDVEVRSANVAVITEADDLRLLDTASLQTRLLTTGGGRPLTVKATLPSGYVVYERQVGSDYDLYLYDAFTTANVALGEDANAVERFAAKLGDHRILFTAASSTGEVLKMHDVRTGTTQTVPATTAEGSEVGTVVVDENSHVFFDWARNGTYAVVEYDPATNSTTAIDEAAYPRIMARALPGGGALYQAESATNGPSNRALGYIAHEQTAAYGNGAGTTHYVVAPNGVVVYAAAQDIVAWNPRARTSTAITATAGVTELAALALPNNNIVYHSLVNGTSDVNVVLYDAAAGASRNFPASAVADQAVGNLSDNRVIVSKAEATGTHLYLATYSGGVVNDAPIADTSGQSFELVKVLANDKIVYRNTTSGGLFLFNPGTSGTTSLGATAQFVAEMPTSGDFVFKANPSAQFDLSLWDDSATGTVSLANGTTDEENAYGLSDGRIVFTRAVTGGTTRNLFVWKPSDQSVTQITDNTADHTLVEAFAVSR